MLISPEPRPHQLYPHLHLGGIGSMKDFVTVPASFIYHSSSDERPSLDEYKPEELSQDFVAGMLGENDNDKHGNLHLYSGLSYMTHFHVET